MPTAAFALMFVTRDLSLKNALDVEGVEGSQETNSWMVIGVAPLRLIIEGERGWEGSYEKD